jgi:hypothetical protein
MCVGGGYEQNPIGEMWFSGREKREGETRQKKGKQKEKILGEMHELYKIQQNQIVHNSA